MKFIEHFRGKDLKDPSADLEKKRNQAQAELEQKRVADGIKIGVLKLQQLIDAFVKKFALHQTIPQEIKDLADNLREQAALLDNPSFRDLNGENGVILIHSINNLKFPSDEMLHEISARREKHPVVDEMGLRKALKNAFILTISNLEIILKKLENLKY